MSLNKDLREKYSAKTTGMGRVVVPFSTTASLDLKLPAIRWISGIRLILIDQNEADTFLMTVVDKDYFFAGTLYPLTPTDAGIPDVVGLGWDVVVPGGLELERFGMNIPVQTDKQDQGKEETGYWGKLEGNMYVRIEYTSQSVDTDVILKAIAYLHSEKF